MSYVIDTIITQIYKGNKGMEIKLLKSHRVS